MEVSLKIQEDRKDRMTQPLYNLLMLGFESAWSRAAWTFSSSLSTHCPLVLSFSVASHYFSKKAQPPHQSLQRPAPSGSCLHPRPLPPTHSAPWHSSHTGLRERCQSFSHFQPFVLAHSAQMTRPAASHVVAAPLHFRSQPTVSSSCGSALSAPLNQASPVILQFIPGVSPPRHWSQAIHDLFLPLLGY